MLLNIDSVLNTEMHTQTPTHMLGERVTALSRHAQFSLSFFLCLGFECSASVYEITSDMILQMDWTFSNFSFSSVSCT